MKPEGLRPVACWFMSEPADLGWPQRKGKEKNGGNEPNGNDEFRSVDGENGRDSRHRQAQHLRSLSSSPTRVHNCSAIQPNRPLSLSEQRSSSSLLSLSFPSLFLYCFLCDTLLADLFLAWLAGRDSEAVVSKSSRDREYIRSQDSHAESILQIRINPGSGFFGRWRPRVEVINGVLPAITERHSVSRTPSRRAPPRFCALYI
jgi:hypothetical protein